MVVALLLSVGVLAVFGFIATSSLRELLTDMEQYEKRLKVLGEQATKLLDRHGADLLTTQLELAVRARRRPPSARMRALTQPALAPSSSLQPA